MNRKQKDALAGEILHAVDSMLSVWGENATPSELDDVSVEEIYQQVADWMDRLPGNGWINTWPKPSRMVRKF